MSGDTLAADRGPGVRVPPPVLVAAVLALAWAVERLAPVPLGTPLPRTGWWTMAAGGALTLWALGTMIRARTDPRPDRPDATLVEAGPFRLSRNPVYLGFVLAAAGLALLWASLWLWLGALAAAVVLDRVVIAREERYLRGRFGTAYTAYAARVRRWV